MTRGGKREKAGLKPATPGNSLVVPVCATVSAEEAARIEAARGTLSRSQWIRAAILAQLEKPR